MTSPRDFLEAIFRDLGDAEAVALATTVEHDGRIVFPAEPWRPGAPVWHRASHFAVGALLKDQSDRFARKKSYFSRAFAFVLDDIHEKATPPQIEPTWKMLTKPGSEQWGYAFSAAMRDQQAFDDLVAAFIAAGHSDPGATGSVRLVRLPDSKPLGKEHAAKLIHFDQERRMEPDPELILKEFGLKKVRAPRSASSTGSEGLGGDDPVLEWLADQGRVLGPERSDGWTPVLCPWMDEHTDGPQKETGTGYRAVGHDGYRAFKCHHRCSGLHVPRDTNRFLDWVRQNGGPDVGTKDERLIEARKEEYARLRKGVSPAQPDPVVLLRVEELGAARTNDDRVRILNSLVWLLLRDDWSEPEISSLLLGACPEIEPEWLADYLAANVSRMLTKQEETKQREWARRRERMTERERVTAIRGHFDRLSPETQADVVQRMQEALR